LKMRTARSKCTIGEIISFLNIFFTMKPINNALRTPLMTNDHSLSKNNKTLAEIKKQKIANMSDCGDFLGCISKYPSSLLFIFYSSHTSEYSVFRNVLHILGRI